jgi:FkbM family methyltransferase
MSFLSFIYRQWLNNCDSDNFAKKIYSTFFKILRGLILRFADPPIKMPVRDKTLWMPFSHYLPYYVHVDPQYDTLIGRLAQYIRSSQGRITGIDCGANIGDTILACSPVDTDRFLAIEAHPDYFAYLRRNLGSQNNISLLQALCGAQDGRTGVHIEASRGTAQTFQTNDDETRVNSARLDTLLQDNAEFRNCNLLKIDTDGHDFDVIRGARELITRAKPAVFFECDVFQNMNFVDDVMEAFKLFAQAGYQDALIYDNQGYFLCRIDPKEPALFEFFLFHKVTTQRYYFDVLMLPARGRFLDEELDYYASLAPGANYLAAARKVAELIKSCLA